MKNGGYRSSTAKKKAIVVVAHAMIVINLAHHGHRKAVLRAGRWLLRQPPGP